MSDLPHIWPGYIQFQEQQFTAAVAEYTGQRMGQAMNYLKDANDATAAAVAAINATTSNAVKGALGSVTFFGGGELLISSAAITILSGSVVVINAEAGPTGGGGSFANGGLISIFGGFILKRGSTVLAKSIFGAGAGAAVQMAPTINFTDTGLGAGTYTYNLYMYIAGNPSSANADDMRIALLEQHYR